MVCAPLYIFSRVVTPPPPPSFAPIRSKYFLCLLWTGIGIEVGVRLRLRLWGDSSWSFGLIVVGEQETLQSLHLVSLTLTDRRWSGAAQEGTSYESFSLKQWRRCPLGSLTTSQEVSDQKRRWGGRLITSLRKIYV